MTTRRPRGLAWSAWLVVSLWMMLMVGCGENPAGDAGVDQGSDNTSMEISEVESQTEGSAVTVTGFLIEDGGVVYLAEMLAESFPPQAGGTTIVVTGLDPEAMAAAEVEGPVRWLDGPVTLEATVSGGELAEASMAGDG